MEQNDPRVIQDAAAKRQRVRDWLQNNQLDGVVISRRDQFAWLTAGGDNRVLNNSETGFGHAVLTAEKQYLVAHSMDALRLFEEQVPGQEYELVSMNWFEGDPRLRALALAGKRPCADTIVPGIPEVNQALSYLHYPLTELEIERSRALAGAVAEVLEETALTVRPGQTEREIAARLHSEMVRRGIDLDVLIVGSDERIFKYRHPLPTARPVEKYVLLHPAARRWGLHANVSRSLYFGKPAPQVEKAYTAVATLQAYLLAELKEGLPFARILDLQKQWYAQLGFPDEWRGHFQGGPTGYMVVDTGRNQTDTCVQNNQAFDWFVTVTGAKVEELTLLTARGAEIASRGSRWPGMEIATSRGPVDVPALWVR